MKVACDICEKIEDADRIKDWLSVRTEVSKYLLCCECEKEFWKMIQGIRKVLRVVKEDEDNRVYHYCPECERHLTTMTSHYPGCGVKLDWRRKSEE